MYIGLEVHRFTHFPGLEWDQKESLAEEEKLEWEDNWDDVDAEDDFTAALR